MTKTSRRGFFGTMASAFAAAGLAPAAPERMIDRETGIAMRFVTSFDPPATTRGAFSLKHAILGILDSAPPARAPNAQQRQAIEALGCTWVKPDVIYHPDIGYVDVLGSCGPQWIVGEGLYRDGTLVDFAGKRVAY